MYTTTMQAAQAFKSNVHNATALAQVTNTCPLLTAQHKLTQLNSYANEQLYTIATKTVSDPFDSDMLAATSIAIIAMHNSSDEWEYTTTFANTAQANDYLNANMHNSLDAFNALVIIEL